MYFYDYKQHEEATLNPEILWEFETEKFDLNEMRNLVVRGVIEMGWPNDWYFILNNYGIKGVKTAIKNIAYLNDRYMNFVSHQFDIPLKSMKCYEKKQSAKQQWSS